MIRLTQALHAWGSPTFTDTLKAELQQLSADALPLQQGLSLSSCVSDRPFSVVILNVADETSVIRVKAGVFYTGIIAGCNCADDPTPMDEQTEYCELLFDIDRVTGEAAVTLLQE